MPENSMISLLLKYKLLCTADVVNDEKTYPKNYLHTYLIKS